MKKRRQDPLEPKIYLPSQNHPDYLERELEYRAQHYKGTKQRTRLGFWSPNILCSHYLREIKQAKVYSNESDKYVIEAVKLFSDHPIELSVSLSPLQFSEEAKSLGAAVCRVLGSLRSQALGGRYEERTKAKMRLRKIVKGITPDTRGKKKRTADPYAIRWTYWYELFRLYHIQRTLRSSLRNMSAKVKAASENFGIPVQSIRDLWGLDEDDMSDKQPFTLKEMARQLTAKEYKITQQRVSNILSV